MARKVLVVDDAVLMRTILREILENYGFEVSGEAENGYEAIEKYQQLNPDLVTLDITMPELNGLETLKALKALDKDCKVVIISALEHEKIVGEALACGAQGFIVKPFQVQTIIDTLLRL
ncbi:two-component system chemotaxis response regulator CheY [Hydrogenispora ethanolica]|jgi:two-component system chemotaxis response regulator CheY|uniref:Two-component system chemotaxis response regulator CheY n=1 Tax=Hydrogenispora ethanolica TaxID=1082276 RepID=A0A4R1RFK3_HYDET|nr:response regulator [Hydrogenispora ethanolica]TCL64758.1 two-component system chemotaxis response regulator CheY [Hydrogenispora ethanolica]